MEIQYSWLVLVGVILGAGGTFIGAGGGSLLMPALVLMYPGENREILAYASLVVVFFNALSGSAAYATMKRIDYRSGLIFAAAAVPGAVLGALLTSSIHRGVFDAVLGLMLIAGAIFLLVHPRESDKAPVKGPGTVTGAAVGKDGRKQRYSFNALLAAPVNFVAGGVSSFLGIGSTFLQVPAMIYLFAFPVHIATATSQFVLCIMALAGVVTHVCLHETGFIGWRTGYLILGVIVGAPFGAMLSGRVKGRRIMRVLGVILGLVGIRILMTVF